MKLCSEVGVGKSGGVEERFGEKRDESYQKQDSIHVFEWKADLYNCEDAKGRGGVCGDDSRGDLWGTNSSKSERKMVVLKTGSQAGDGKAEDTKISTVSDQDGKD